MIPLIKIRATYLKRKKAQVIFTYLFIPIIIIIGVFIYIAKKEPEGEMEFNGKQTFNYDYGPDFYLFKNINYTTIKPYISNTSLIVNDNEIGNKLVQYIEDEFNVSLNLYTEENQLNNHSQNIVILNYDKDKNSYKFTYKEKEIVNTREISYFPFKTSQLSSLISSDVFNYEYGRNYNTTDYHNKIFITYQSLFAKFLIEKIEGKSIDNKDILFNFGLNSYPEAVKNPRNYDNLEPMLGYIITMQFTFVFLSFGIQMLEEKEKKLEKILERQG